MPAKPSSDGRRPTAGNLPLVAIGGGAHGVNVHVRPVDLVAALGAEVADVTVPDEEPPAS